MTTSPEPVTLDEPIAAFVGEQRVARLATSDTTGKPHVVPVCYAFDGARFYTPIDEKPKRADCSGQSSRADGRNLLRVRNILARPDVSLLIDRYDEDWSQLGYALITAHATLLDPGDPQHAHALRLLRDRYPQYRAMALESRPVIALTPTHVTAWGPALAAAETGDPATAQSRWLQPGRGVDFLPLARGRRSVRVYEDRPVPRAALDEVMEAARWAPSPHGRQPWRFVVLTRAEPKAQLAEAMGEEWRRTLAMDGQPPEITALRLDKSHERIRNVPALVLVCLYLADLDAYPDADRQRAEEIMAIQSLGAAVENLLLAAYALGLDGGWMCAPLFCPNTVRAALGLDATLIPHALITLGYAARDPKRRPHRPLGDLVVRFD
ncbi:MAG: TIGR03668 family PPOX class F420-dependent oxidoreductase [Ktedonobacterales bacterium]